MAPERKAEYMREERRLNLPLERCPVWQRAARCEGAAFPVRDVTTAQMVEEFAMLFGD